MSRIPVSPGAAEILTTEAKVYPSHKFHMHSSPDGLNWKLFAKVDPGPGSYDTQTVVFWDPDVGRYVMYTRCVITYTAPVRMGDEDWFYCNVISGDHAGESGYYHDRHARHEGALYVQKHNRSANAHTAGDRWLRQMSVQSALAAISSGVAVKRRADHRILRERT